MQKILTLFFLLFTSGSIFANNNHDFVYDDFTLTVKNVRTIGEELKIDFIALNQGPTSDVAFFLSRIEIYNQDSKKLTLKSGQVGIQQGGSYSVITSSLVRNIPINLSLSFSLDGEEIESVKMINFPITIEKGNQKFSAILKNIPNNYRLRNPYPDSEKEIKFNEKSLLIDDDVTLSITGFKVIGEELRLEFKVDNQSKKTYSSAFSVSQSRMIDPLGEEFPIETLMFGEQEGKKYHVVNKDIPSDFEIKGYFAIKHHSPTDINMIKLLEINIGKKPFYITNIGLSKN